uniref:Bestrophin homolog n=1 Tax=Plectus sambesii TaxID=2011161 RepID=A0A914XBN7_9BILA
MAAASVDRNIETRRSIWSLGSPLPVTSFVDTPHATALANRTFEDIAGLCFKYTDFIPLTFILGFFVSLVVNRWWDMFNNIGWIDNTALYVAAYIQGSNDDVRMIRRNIIRYLVVVQTMVFRDISPPIRLRYPTMKSLQEAGLLNEAEMIAFDGVESHHAKYWLPIHWAMALIYQAREREFMISDGMVMDLFNRLREYRTGLATLCCYDWVPVPLAYTQVVFLTVRCYFLIALMGRQYVSTKRDIEVHSAVDLYFPLITVIQFLFYMGWMKVAEALLNPFGADADDFEVNYILDRNLQVGINIVDDAAGSLPKQEKDSFWFEKQPTPLYSTEMANVAMNPAVGSATEIPTPEVSTLMVPRTSPSVSRKSSKQPSSVGDFFKSMKSHGPRSSSRECDKFTKMDELEQGLTLSVGGADLPVTKTLPVNLNEMENKEREKHTLRPTETAPAILRLVPTAKKSPGIRVEGEASKETASALGALLEQDESET